MKKLLGEFKAFINKGNALSLAIGVIIGASFTAIVSAINTKIISPLIGLVLGDNDLSESLVTVLSTEIDPVTGEEVVTNAIYWGAFNDMQVRIDFKLEKGIKLTKREKAFVEKVNKEKAEKEEAERNKVIEPSFEEKQLALLNSINENLSQLKK